METTEIRREVQVDTKLGELHGKLAEVYAREQGALRTIAGGSDLKPEWGKGQERGKLVYHSFTRAEIVEAGEAKLADSGGMAPYEIRYIEEALAKLPLIDAEIDAIRAEMKPLNDEYAAAPWSRFFLVTSSAGGHIHRAMSCSTTRITTGFAWLPELSGLSEKDAVEAHGTILCSVCFPTAPVEWTLGNEKPADPDQCPGSGTYKLVEGTYRQTGWSGNGNGYCAECRGYVGVTTTGKIRKHKRGGAA